VKWATSTGYLPVRASVKNDVIDIYKKDPRWGLAADSYAKMFDWAQYGMIESPVAGYDPVREIIDKEILTRVVTDSTVEPKKLVDEGVEKANAILKENAPKR
jgi:ABC-type glycerol-3-phosphate transport system substrate-binding protein